MEGGAEGYFAEVNKEDDRILCDEYGVRIY